MILNPIGTTATTNTGASANATNDPAAMQDRFLKLLVAQLNNQDPMNPLDNAQMTTQMAQINTVTGIQTLNLTMQTMAEEFSTMQQIQGISLIGRSVLTEGDRLSVSDGKGKGYFNLDNTATDVQVDIVTPGGVVVDTVDLGAQDKAAALSSGTPPATAATPPTCGSACGPRRARPRSPRRDCPRRRWSPRAPTPVR